jgi:Flp pilus assembly protein TadG
VSWFGSTGPSRRNVARGAEGGAARPAPSRRRRSQQDAQATVEFAVVFTLFLVMLFAILDAWLWTIESGAADAAVEQGIGVALAAPTTSPTSTGSDLAAVFPYAMSVLRAPMLGTAVGRWTVSSGGGCPAAAIDVERVQGVGHVDVCAVRDGHGHVTVAVAGYSLSVVPPGLSLFELPAWGLPIYESASVSVGTYAP